MQPRPKPTDRTSADRLSSGTQLAAQHAQPGAHSHIAATTGWQHRPYPRVGPERLKSLPRTATRQFDLCVLTPVIPSELNTLRELLERLRDETLAQMRGLPTEHPLLDWASLQSVHYARFVIIDAYPRFGTGPYLAFSSNYDGPLGDDSASRSAAQRAHIAELMKHAGCALDSIYRCCQGYSGMNNMASYLARHQRKAAAFYVGSSGRPRDQVIAEAALRDRVHEVLDELYSDEPDLEPEQVRERVRRDPRISALGLPDFPAQPDRRWQLYLALLAAGLPLFAVVAGLFSGMLPLQLAAGAVIVGLGLAVLWLRYRERTDPEFEPKHSSAERRHIAWASADEDLFLQNQLTHLVDVKAGMFRHVLLRLVLFAIQLLARSVYNKGKLGSIPSIHFARWCLIDRGRRLLFFSNFDNSWESYLGDFIDQASSGLTAVWSNTVLYPTTRWLVGAGSEDASRFKAWTRHYQLPTQVWYSAYSQLSIRNVNTNTEIRRGLAAPHSMPANVWLDWLQGVDRRQVDELTEQEKLQSTLAPHPTKSADVARPTLDLSDVQGILVRGYGPRRGAQFVMLRVAEGRAASARRWLGDLPLTNAISGKKTADTPDPLLNVAFSFAGLSALEVDPGILEDFPVAFVEGADGAARARVNGDVGESDPSHWRWGSGDHPVHVLLLVYATTPEAALAHADRLLTEAESAGLGLVTRLEGGELPGRKEHFGFRDGIAQPVIRGSGRPEPAYNTVEAGEFLLGHVNEYGNRAHAPRSPTHESFGVNGSYLVFRQLEQDVSAFWRYCQNQGSRLRLDTVSVASKMVGRWPSGASLVKHAMSDPKSEEFQDEDAFAYLASGRFNDADGRACPLGSHLRRTNPRDWDSGATRLESIRIANRHRLIRRGRPYGAPLAASMGAEALIRESHPTPDAAERGLQFLAFCADLERQFEFVQQQWSQNPSFGGLASGPDAVSSGPLAMQAASPPNFTIQSDATSSSFGRCTGLTHFVKVRGGAYFFMPSLSSVASLKQPR